MPLAGDTRPGSGCQPRRGPGCPITAGAELSRATGERGGPPQEQLLSACAHNGQIWTAQLVLGFRPNAVHIGGSGAHRRNGLITVSDRGGRAGSGRARECAGNVPGAPVRRAGEHGIAPPGPVASTAVEGLTGGPADVAVADAGIPEDFRSANHQGGAGWRVGAPGVAGGVASVMRVWVREAVEPGPCRTVSFPGEGGCGWPIVMGLRPSGRVSARGRVADNAGWQAWPDSGGVVRRGAGVVRCPAVRGVPGDRRGDRCRCHADVG